MTSVQERIKRLNELNSEVKAPTSQHLGNIDNRGQSLSKPNVSTTLSKEKSHLFKAAKLIQKSFSSDSAEGDASLFFSSSNKQQRTSEDETRKNVPSDDPNPIRASLSDDEDDGELDAAAAMSYWRNRGKGNNIDRNEAREHSSTVKTTAANGSNRTSAPVIKPTGARQKITSNNQQVEREPVVLPLSPPRLQHMQPPQSTFNQDVFGSSTTRQPTKAEEEAPFDIVAADSESPANNSAKLQYAMSPTTAPILSVKSSESVMSGGTETSCASTLSTRAKKFLKEKRKNGPILTGRGGVNGNTDGVGAETNRSKTKSILRERAAKDRLQKQTAATMATKAHPIAVGEADDLGQYSNMSSISNVGKRDELGEDITQIKADSPFDEPSNKKNDTMESTVSSDQLRNFAFASIDKVKENQQDNASRQSGSTKDSSKKPDKDVIRVTQQGRPSSFDYDGSVSEYTMNSTINNDSVISNDASQLTSKGSLPSIRDRKTSAQRENQPKSGPVNEEEDFLEVMGSAAFDAGCQVLEAFESLKNTFIGTEDEKVKTNDVPFDEDVAIEVEYVDPKRSTKSARDRCTVNVERR